MGEQPESEGVVRPVGHQELAVFLRRGEAQVVDVRTLDYFIARIPGCVHMPYPDFHSKVGMLAHKVSNLRKVLVFLCTCGESKAAVCAQAFLTYMNTHKPMHYCDVRVLEGGFYNWERQFATDVNASIYINRGFVFNPEARSPMAVSTQSNLDARTSETCSKKFDNLPFRRSISVRALGSNPESELGGGAASRASSRESCRARRLDGSSAGVSLSEEAGITSPPGPHALCGARWQARRGSETQKAQTADSLPELIPLLHEEVRGSDSGGEVSPSLSSSGDNDRSSDSNGEHGANGRKGSAGHSSYGGPKDAWYDSLAIGEVVRVRSGCSKEWYEAIVVAVSGNRARVQYMMRGRSFMKIVNLASSEVAPVGPEEKSPPSDKRVGDADRGLGGGSSSFSRGNSAGTVVSFSGIEDEDEDWAAEGAAMSSTRGALAHGRPDDGEEEGLLLDSDEEKETLPLAGRMGRRRSTGGRGMETRSSIVAALGGDGEATSSSADEGQMRPLVTKMRSDGVLGRRKAASDHSSDGVLLAATLTMRAERRSMKGSEALASLRRVADLAALRGAGAADLGRMSPEQLKVGLEGVPPRMQVLDVRDRAFFHGHIDGARHLPARFFDARVPKLVLDCIASAKTHVVLYCDEAEEELSVACARLLQRHLRESKKRCGIELNLQVQVLAGGYRGWQVLSAAPSAG